MRISRHWACHEVGFRPTFPHSAIFECCCWRQRLLFFLIYLACQAVRKALRKNKQNRILFIIWWGGGIVVECHSRLQNFEGHWECRLGILSKQVPRYLWQISRAVSIPWRSCSHVGLMIKKYSGNEITWQSWRRRFRKVPFSKCSPSTLIRLAGVFKFFHSGDRFQNVPLSKKNLSGFVRVSVKGRRNQKKIYPA